MATPNENKDYIDSKSKIEEEENIDWENGEATYGHKRQEFKRKGFSENAFLGQNIQLSHSYQNESKNFKVNKDEDIGIKNL